ncbi:MAG TPA: hypothetical protein VKE74_05330, partial [Gemmataceae bacterium]|nr:hypothetical protein [Gemmataceae bacterium]
RQHRARSLWGWHAVRFAYETRDPIDPVPTEGSFKFTSTAARACLAAAAPLAEPYLELDPIPGLVLKPGQLEAEFGVKLRLLGAAEQRKVAVRVLSPSGEWVRAAGESAALFDPIRGGSVKFRVEAGEHPEAHPELKGVLIEAAIADGRAYHRRVPVGLDELTNRLDLVIRPAIEGARPVRAVELRPNGDPQSYELRLVNPGRKPQTVIVRLPQYDRETDKVTVEGGKDVKLKFKPPPPSPAPPIPVPAPMGAPPPPPVDLFDPVKGNELEVVLLDPTDPEKVLQRFAAPVQVLDPTQYIRVKDVAFTPAIGARPNRLELTIDQGRVPPGPPVPVAATLPRERNPDVVRVQDANLSAPLPPGGRPLTLYAENTTFKIAPQTDVGPPPEEQPRVVVTVAADGVERIFTFTGSLPLLGGKVALNPVTHPMVRVRARPLPPDPKEPPPPMPPPSGPIPVKPYTEPVYASGLVPLPLELEVDNAPEGATVQIRLGTLRPDLSTGKPVFVPDVTLPLAPNETPIPAKERFARIKFDNKGETLSFKGTLKDPAPTLPVEVLVGERVIEARLIGPDGKVLLDPDRNEAVGRTRVIFDGAKPTGVEFIGLQPRLAQAKVLALRATSDMPVSGVKEVKFFVGRPVDDAPPPGATPVPGVLFDPQANEWRAVLPIEGLKDRQVIGVQFVSKAGQRKAGEA